MILATAGSTKSVRTIIAHLLTYGEQPSGVVTLEQRYGPQRLRDDDDDDDDVTDRQLMWPLGDVPIKIAYNKNT